MTFKMKEQNSFYKLYKKLAYFCFFDVNNSVVATMNIPLVIRFAHLHFFNYFS